MRLSGFLNFRITPLWILAVLCIVSCSSAATFEGSLGYFGDNMALMCPSYYLAMNDIAVPGGEISLNAGFLHWRMSSSSNGIRRFGTDIATAEAAYIAATTPVSYGLRMHCGVSGLATTQHYFVYGEIPVKITPAVLPGFRILSSTGIRYGYADDNPFMAAMGANKLSAVFNAGIGIRFWEVHAGYSYGKYDRIEREAYKPLLEDTLFFSVLYDTLNPILNLIDVHTTPFPANENHQFALYFFGPVFPFLYSGASFTYRNMTTNYYLPIADSDNGRICFTYFPYRTPHKEGSFNLILSAVHATDDVSACCNKAELKINFPVYSFGSYRGYYQAASGNILAGFKDFYFDYYGTGAISVDAEYKKLFSHGFGLGLTYSWVSQPYVAYHFFGKDSYQYHTLRFSLSKGF
jgi:hypothetical protein